MRMYSACCLFVFICHRYENDGEITGWAGFAQRLPDTAIPGKPIIQRAATTKLRPENNQTRGAQTESKKPAVIHSETSPSRIPTGRALH